MHKIKQLPEDFIVKEISEVDTGQAGFYAYFLLKKKNYSTMGALEVLSEKTNILLKNFGFAGNKDKVAVTEQKISVYRGSRGIENFQSNGIELKYLGNGKNPISLGDLKGNEFTITIRNLDDKDIKKIQKCENKNILVPNLFGPQRFSKNNHLAGKSIIKKDFKKAVELILENKGGVEKRIGEYLGNSRNNFIGALRLIPLKTRKIFIHAYQSSLFNKTIEEYLLKYENNAKNIEVPVIGFGFGINEVENDELKKIIKNMIDEEKINPRDFIISQMPELTSEGGYRNLFFEVGDLKILEIEEDELDDGMKKIKINFSLPKSCYATTLIDFIFR